MRKYKSVYFVKEACLKREQKIRVRWNVVTKVGKTDNIFPI